MILVGEPHPDLPLEPMIRSMGLSAHVRVLGFTDAIEDFVGLPGGLRHRAQPALPHGGRKLRHAAARAGTGQGRAGFRGRVAFRELPDDVCLKVPVDAGEEDMIFEYLNLLVSRPEVAHALGARARSVRGARVQLASVARRYAEFLELGGGTAGSTGRGEGVGRPASRVHGTGAGALTRLRVSGPRESPIPYLRTWAADEPNRRATWKLTRRAS